MGPLHIDFAGRVAQKAAHMAQIDPHGWTLTLVSVSVVFGVLLILFLAYAIIGGIFTGKLKRERNDSGVAAAAGPCVHGAMSDEELAAVAAALDRYFREEEAHDTESCVITIRRH